MLREREKNLGSNRDIRIMEGDLLGSKRPGRTGGDSGDLSLSGDVSQAEQ